MQFLIPIYLAYDSISHSPLSFQVHPRTYGATCLIASIQIASFGTSPHLRGYRIAGRGLWRPERYIPAPTGLPGAGCTRLQWRGVHPRTYGATG